MRSWRSAAGNPRLVAGSLDRLRWTVCNARHDDTRNCTGRGEKWRISGHSALRCVARRSSGCVDFHTCDAGFVRTSAQMTSRWSPRMFRIALAALVLSVGVALLWLAADRWASGEAGGVTRDTARQAARDHGGLMTSGWGVWKRHSGLLVTRM